jgi:spectinomycin phosphotransferase
MLEEPAIRVGDIATCLSSAYGLHARQIAFLPLGADENTAVYRVETQDGQEYFLKLRRGRVFEPAILIPNYLHTVGVEHLIAALATQMGGYFARLGEFTLILYPYVRGRNGYEQPLSPQQWVELGAVMKQIHGLSLPGVLRRAVPNESFSGRWRNSLRNYLEAIAEKTYSDTVSAELSAFLRLKRVETLELIESSEQLAGMVEQQRSGWVLCHADLHVWNLLLDEQGGFYIVDWDTLLFAPKERDLMFIGSGLGGNGPGAVEETRLFYLGYGPTDIQRSALAYFRVERIVEDIAVYCEQIFMSSAGGADREQAVVNVMSNFLPGGTIEMARES